MIRLSSGHVLEYTTASCALGYDGRGWPWERPLRWFRLLEPELFTSITKTLTLKPRRGNLRWYNPWRCVRLIKDGTVNAVGLTNPGFDWWCETIGPRVNSLKIPLIVSLLGTPDELVAMARALNRFDLVALELNASCPNTGSGFVQDSDLVIASCAAIKANSRFPLILKLSAAQDVETIVPAVQPYVEALSVNSVPWRLLFPVVKSPLARFGGGGVSGRVAQPVTWALVQRLTKLGDIPVIGPSIWDFDDLAKVRSLGAKAVSFGSVFLRYPWRPSLFVWREQGLLT